MTNDAPHIDQLIGSLVGEMTPVRPARFLRVAAVVIAVELGAAWLAAWALGARMAAAERLGDPMFLALLGVLAAGCIASSLAMAGLGMPGRVVSKQLRLLLVVLPMVLAIAIVALSPWGATWTGVFAVLTSGIGCTRDTLLIAIPAWVAGLLYLRRLAPLEPFAAGLFTSSAALLASALFVQVACPSCESWHLAVSHYSPIVVAAWMGAILSVPVLSAGRRG